MNEPHDPLKATHTAKEARQAVPVHRMRYVLGLGIAGVIVAFLIAWYVLAGS